MTFRNRHEAGRRLARLAAGYAGPDTVVLGLPRGGVPVAYEVATAMNAPLDVFVARKLGAPMQPEFAVGAIAPGGVRVLDERALRSLGIAHGDIDRIEGEERAEMERRLLTYRGSPKPPDVAGKTVILVDDGLATGATARAAVRSLRQQGPLQIVLAIPVGAPDSVEQLRAEADEVLVVETPEPFQAVGAWYDEFDQTTDEEVLALLRRARVESDRGYDLPVEIDHDSVVLHGDLTLPRAAKGLIIFAHGSGSSRKSPRNRQVARILNDEGFGTLLLDLLTADEERVDEWTRELRFDVTMLSRRVVSAIDWSRAHPSVAGLDVGLFGASTGAAAALMAAAQRPHDVRAVVSRGGRPDLAGTALPLVGVASLFIVGSLDEDVLDLNREAVTRMRKPARIEIVPGATHLFEEPGKLEVVADLAASFFAQHLAPRATSTAARRAHGGPAA